jgi:hypothetical protein
MVGAWADIDRVLAGFESVRNAALGPVIEARNAMGEVTFSTPAKTLFPGLTRAQIEERVREVNRMTRFDGVTYYLYLRD